MPAICRFRELCLPIRGYGHDGAFFPETMTIWGTYLDKNYGTCRTGKRDGQTDNSFIRRYWQGGIEMVAMMLDYYDLTQDDAFRDHTLMPYAKAITTFFDQHWKLRAVRTAGSNSIPPNRSKPGTAPSIRCRKLPAYDISYRAC